jgi:hypothetical protein
VRCVGLPQNCAGVSLFRGLGGRIFDLIHLVKNNIVRTEELDKPMSFQDTPNSTLPDASAALIPPFARSDDALLIHSNLNFFLCGIEKLMSGAL